MKRLLILVSLLVLTLMLSLSIVNAQAASRVYIILMEDHALPATLAQDVQAAGGQLMHTIPQVGIATAVSSDPNFAGWMSLSFGVASVGTMPTEALPMASIEAHATGPNASDDLYNNGLLWGINRVNAPAAWAAGITGDHNTVVAVIDTGLATNHPDLAPNIVHVACYTSQPTCNPYPSYSDHGTHVAGTIAAAFGHGRVVGVGPNLGLAGYNTFEPIAGCGVCSYTSSRWLAEVDAADRGFDVINMSLGALGGYGGQDTNELATFVAADNRVANYVLKKGTVIVASAGNSAVNLNGVLINLPGGLPGVVNTGATGIRPQPRYPQAGAYDVRAFFSNFGASVDIVAPGGDCGMPNDCVPATRPANYAEYLILSSIVAPNPACAATQSCAVGYGWKGGTSMASPHVAGVAALVRQQNPGLTPKQVVARLRSTAQDLGSRQQFGHGMVNAAAALGLP